MVQKIPASGLDSQRPFRNLFINGDMSIAQRATSATGLTGSSYPTIDRMSMQAASAGTWTQSQSTDVPTGEGFATSLKMDCTTANGSLSSGSYLIIDQRFEGQMLQHLKKGTSNAQKVTLSFFVKSAKTGTYIVNIRDDDNTRNISKSYTISSADTWEKKVIVFDADTSGALDNDNAQSFAVLFFLAAGSDRSSGTLATSWESTTNANRAVGQVNLADSTDNDWYLTGVQLEVGDTASDFEHLPFDVQERRCFRYFQTLAMTTNSIKVAAGTSSTVAQIDFEYPNGEMRTSPTITLPAAGNSSGTTAFLTAVGAYPSTIGTHSVSTTTEIHTRVTCASYSANLTAGGAHLFYSNGTNTFKMDAEL